jgi:two-component sensor histidine kinase
MRIDDIRDSDRLLRKALAELNAASDGAATEEKALQQQIATMDASERHTVAPLTLVCVVLAVLALHNVYRLRRFWERERQTAGDLLLAVQETNHRIKNNLQVVAALVDIHRTEAGDTIPKSALDEISSQVRAVAAVHDFLSYALRSTSVQADRMLEKLAALCATASHLTVDLNADVVMLAVKQATAVALICNELLSNSGKHGATHATVSMCAEAENVRLDVVDNGPGFPPDFDPVTSANLGLALLDTLVRHDLGGDITYATGSGARVTIVFPLRPAAASVDQRTERSGQTH